MSQLYNISYLEQTTQVLGQLKQQSYQPFSNITEGHIADVGCGTGADAINMAKMLGSKVQVTGLDISEEMIGKARSSAGDLDNIRFDLAAADALPFADNMLAGLRNERLIQHLPDAPKAFAEFYRVLQPGRSLVTVETAWSSIAFYNGDTAIARQLHDYLTFENVKNGNAAASLITYMKDAGFKDIAIEVFPFVLRSLQQVFQMLRTDHALQMMLEKGHLTQEQYNSFLADIEDADRNHYFACSIDLVVATAIK